MRLAENPNTTDQPVEVTSLEVSRLAKTGCNVCHGAGYLVYAKKEERGQLVASGRPGICRCVAKHFLNRPDVREFDAKLHWMPRDGKIVCGFRWLGEAGAQRRCALPPHPVEMDHCDESGARVAHPKLEDLVGASATEPLPAAQAAEGAAP